MSEKEIKILLTKIGIRPSYKGFPYLAYIIMLALNQNGCIKLKNLYKSASKHFDTNEVLIHQNIQSLINVYRITDFIDSQIR